MGAVRQSGKEVGSKVMSPDYNEIERAGRTFGFRDRLKRKPRANAGSFDALLFVMRTDASAQLNQALQRQKAITEGLPGSES